MYVHMYLCFSTKAPDSTPWIIPTLTCDRRLPCFSRCYARPASMTLLNRSCPSFTYVYVRCGTYVTMYVFCSIHNHKILLVNY